MTIRVKNVTNRARQSASGRSEVAAHIGLMIVSELSRRGVDPTRLCAEIGFNPTSAANPTARITLAIEQALWESAAEECSDSDFGLHTAEVLKPGVLDVLDYAVRSAPTFGTALERLLRYSRLAHEPAIFRLVLCPSTIRVEHSFRPGFTTPCRQEAEFTIASISVIAEQIVEKGLKPVAVEFMHAKPNEIREHVRIFGLEPKFSRVANALVFHRAMMDRPLITADTVLSRIVERHAETLLGALPPDTIAEQVRRVLVKALPEGQIAISKVARILGTSERTLQRRLVSEGTTFAGVLDTLRHDLALGYLAGGRMTLAEIAYLLGYSEPSPFHRAFKRWTRNTLLEVRKPSR